MIVREEDKAFVMIQQHHHAAISAAMMQQFRSTMLAGDSLAETVLLAIRQHDCGWDMFDKQPFWNDEKQAPYAFTDFPGMPKTVLYTHGIDKVEKQNRYAALLCSAHYTRFVKRQTDLARDQFLAQERKRREQIMKFLPFYDPERFDRHLAILQLADNLSLYVCLNAPGVQQAQEHPFFQDGIPVGDGISELVGAEKIVLRWIDQQTVKISGLPPVEDFFVDQELRKVDKADIRKNGLLAAYDNTPIAEQRIHFQM